MHLTDLNCKNIYIREFCKKSDKINRQFTGNGEMAHTEYWYIALKYTCQRLIYNSLSFNFGNYIFVRKTPVFLID